MFVEGEFNFSKEYFKIKPWCGTDLVKQKTPTTRMKSPTKRAIANTIITSKPG